MKPAALFRTLGGRPSAPIIGLLALLASSGSATAQRKVSPSTRAEVKKLTARAFGHARKGAFLEAIPDFERVFALDGDPAAIFNIAVAYESLPDRCGDALATWKRYFESCPEPCKLRADALARRAQVEARCVATGIVTSVPPGATVLLDGKPIGRAPSSIRVAPGEHTLALELEDHLPHAQPLTAAAGAPIAVQVELVRLGRLNLRGATAKMDIQVDGVGWPASPADPRPLAPGPHRISVRRPGEATARVMEVSVASGAVSEVDLGPPVEGERSPPADAPGGGSLRLWGYVAGGLALASVGTAVYFQGASADAVDAERAERATGDPSGARVRELRAEATDDALYAQLGYGLGAAGAAGAGVLLWLGFADEGGPSAWAPVAGPGVVGLQGRF